MELFPYQVEGVRRLHELEGRALLADEMGLGKSLQTIWWLNETKPESLPAVIVCPAQVKPGWERHIVEVMKTEAVTLEGRKPGRLASRKLSRSRLFIINYDILWGWVDALLTTGFKTLVLDEVQYCANRTTKRTKACEALAKEAKNILGLSGTPLMNRPRELWPTLHMIWPQHYPKFWTFGQTYCNPKLTPWGWQFNGATRTRQLHEELVTRGMIRRKKEDVLQDLPPIIREVIPITLSTKQRKEYEEASKTFMIWLQKKSVLKAHRAKKAMAIVKMGELKRLAAKSKLRFVIDWVNNWLEEADPEEKLVLFAVHKAVIRILRENCKAKSVVIDGSTRPEDRKKIIQQFRQDKRTRLCIGNIDSAGTGVDGLQIANAAAFVELAWRPADHSQAESRLNRIGTRSTTWIYYLIAADTIEEKLCRLIQEKQQVVSTVLDGKSTTSDIDVFSKLLDAMNHAN